MSKKHFRICATHTGQHGDPVECAVLPNDDYGGRTLAEIEADESLSDEFLTLVTDAVELEWWLEECSENGEPLEVVE